jgi:hypothetical protein
VCWIPFTVGLVCCGETLSWCPTEGPSRRYTKLRFGLVLLSSAVARPCPRAPQKGHLAVHKMAVPFSVGLVSCGETLSWCRTEGPSRRYTKWRFRLVLLSSAVARPCPRVPQKGHLAVTQNGGLIDYTHAPKHSHTFRTCSFQTCHIHLLFFLLLSLLFYCALSIPLNCDLKPRDTGPNMETDPSQVLSVGIA